MANRVRTPNPKLIAETIVEDALRGTNITIVANADRSLHTGQDSMRIVTVTENYTLVNVDLRDPTIILADSSSPITIFFPANSTVSVKTGVPVEIVQWGTGAVTLAGASGVTVVSAGSPTTKARYATLEVRKILTNTILVSQEVLASGGPVLVSPPSIAFSSGTGASGSVITTTAGTYSPDGTHARQYRRVNLATGAITNIGAGGTTYTTVAGDEGFGVDVVETVTDAAGFSTQGVSNRLTVTASATKPVNTAVPFIVSGGSHAVGGSVTVNAGSWSNTPTGYTFQRRLNGTNSGSPTTQAGATLAYTIQSGDAGGDLSWSVIATNGAGDAAVAAVSGNWAVAGLAPEFTVNPVITYSSTVSGAVLTCSDGTLSIPATLTRRWGFTDPPYTGYIDRNGFQTGSTYTTYDGDIGSQIWCDVTATNASGFVVSRAIGPTITGSAPPPPPPPPNNSSAGARIPTGSMVSSGNIVATTNQVISGLIFSGGTGTKITIPFDVSGVRIVDCDISGGDNCVYNQGTNTTIEFCDIHDSERGVLNDQATNTEIRYCEFSGVFTGDAAESFFNGHALETDYGTGPTNVHHCIFLGTNYPNDVVSFFQTSRVTFTDNVFDVQIDHINGAAFTMGDSSQDPTNPGRDNYVARNIINQSGGAPAGVFGSGGNTIIEYNCFKAGMQIRTYPPENPAPFIGVTVRKNVINIANSFLPAVPLLQPGWDTNVDGTDCALMPA